eukprot:427425-Pyramimonas_sp.AAC.1
MVKAGSPTVTMGELALQARAMLTSLGWRVWIEHAARALQGQPSIRAAPRRCPPLLSASPAMRYGGGAFADERRWHDVPKCACDGMMHRTKRMRSALA